MELININSNATMSSREIAQITGKQHSHVMRDIKEIEAQLDGSKFGLITYTDSRNRQMPMYQLTKKQTLLIISGYDVKIRMAIIDRWEELEKKIQKPMLLEEMMILQLQQAVEVKKRQSLLESEIKDLKTTVDEIQVFNSSVEHFSIMGYCRNIKKQIGISEAKVFGTKARVLCNQLGYVIGRIPDPRFGTVNTYPLDVLREVIN